jgi:hypothetical protein
MPLPLAIVMSAEAKLFRKWAHMILKMTYLILIRIGRA